ncbi:SWIM zinc finger family protein [Stachybotrys elegans]|uniref:SWIM zinc finger family protein n=1 Tax=Stachybotrys elegans TaxID=80388 RepID=A0A8K0T581_9HYPO|nr:SWIM zinc finger family protein [Stachybotrys elegans]
MSAPIVLMSKLSLETMAPTTRSMARQVSPPYPTQYYDDGKSSSDSDDESDGSSFEDEDPDLVRSPTKLLYRLDNLPQESKQIVRDAFDDPAPVALELCRLVDNTYAFQMTELATRVIRIKASSGPADASPRLTCTCGKTYDGPCTHLIRLLDQIFKQTNYQNDNSKPFTMTPEGFAAEMGDPFSRVADHHLDILADGLHCQVADPGANDELDAQRVLESRELLSSVYAAQPEDFRPDIFTNPSPSKRVIKRDDLDHTIFRMLLDNHHFFQYFLSLSRSSHPIKDPFRKLSQRVDHVLRDLDALSAQSPATSSADAPSASSAESPPTVAWAATHLVGCVYLIRSAIFSRDRPLLPREAICAARALVHILSAVVSRNRDAHPGETRGDRNLYQRLIGDLDQDFVIAELGVIRSAASQFLHSLDDIRRKLGPLGAPASYCRKFDDLISRLRTSSAGSSLKRPLESESRSRGPKRMK